MLISVRDSEKVKRWVVIAKCCQVYMKPTEHFYRTLEEAEKGKAIIDAIGCGHSCYGPRGHSIKMRWIRNKELYALEGMSEFEDRDTGN